MDVSDVGPSHIINIKKEKRETDEETKQILRMLEKDDVGTRRLGGWASYMAVERAQGSQGWGKNCSLMSWKPGEQQESSVSKGLKWPWLGGSVGASPRIPKGCRFDPQSGTCIACMEGS